MDTPGRIDPASLRELIVDGGQVPVDLLRSEAEVPAPRPAPVWEVDDECVDQVGGFPSVGDCG
ncbi:hypothetical protein C1701_05575 [Actinoalloteichus sp. AHMU CJ021]|uniref:hypothetical protein n=1 Tax=Actinoalloteichus TaxID=65496 RepID=UPI00047CBCBA|nr:hypothetical protein [Actinoalloteichus caeruleus]AUS77931.1 hypothetical protein C1701_05575 [Actinoalloteichus sp. AHMU CJ021]